MYCPPNKRYKVVQITAPLFLPNQGDTDYTSTLNAALKKQSIISVYPQMAGSGSYNLGNYTKLIEQERIPGIPLIGHIQLRPPNGGTLLPPSYMELFDHTVVTVHEFIHLRKEEEREQVLQYIEQADRVIFSTKHELEAVEKYLPNITDKSSVIPIFPSIELMPRKDALPNGSRPPNVVNFGSIRAGKGTEELIEFARLIRDDAELREYQNRHGKITIYVVGKPVSTRLAGMIVKEAYGLSDEEMPTLKDRHGRSQRRFVRLITEIKQGNREKVLPIELVTDASAQELQDICRNCNFAYLPIRRGATQHSTALPVVMGNGCITITTQGGHTPDALENGAVEFASSPKAALRTLKDYIVHPAKAKHTRTAAMEYLDTISPERAAAQHAEIYSSLLWRRKKLEKGAVSV